jgi:helicase
VAGKINSVEGLMEFFSKSLYAKQFGRGDGGRSARSREFEKIIESVLRELQEFGFVEVLEGSNKGKIGGEGGERIIATPVGRRVSELYIDPLTAFSFMEFVSENPEGASAMELLMELCSSTELRPLLSAGVSEEEALWDELQAMGLGISFDNESARKFKLAKALNYWISEESEEKVLEEFNLPPGILHSKVRVAEWLSYALQELAFARNNSSLFKDAKRLRRRLRHGVKEELLNLTRVRGIGRARARKLFEKGIRDSSELGKAPWELLEEVFGRKRAQSVFDRAREIGER